jgi:hypothetical protein
MKIRKLVLSVGASLLLAGCGNSQGLPPGTFATLASQDFVR